MDQAKGIILYIQAKHPDKGYDVAGAMSELVRYNFKPETLPEEIVLTVRTISKISAKSIQTMHRTISLLKLHPEIQAAIQAGNLSVSQGYIFAAKLECPDRIKIFDAVMKTPVTNTILGRMFIAYKNVKPDPANKKPMPAKKQVKGLVSMKATFEKGLGTYIREDIEKLLDELQFFCVLYNNRCL
ncbi:MAG: hypothetical protein NT178_12965 [Proteobacteria bacterium]|nr:hypothetical protein [Pseudomonadota bacterium]